MPGLQRTAGLLIACHNLWEISQKCRTLPAAEMLRSVSVMKKRKWQTEVSPHFNLRFHSPDGSQAFQGVRGVRVEIGRLWGGLV